jgi:hypothetical protein
MKSRTVIKIVYWHCVTAERQIKKAPKSPEWGLAQSQVLLSDPTVPMV